MKLHRLTAAAIGLTLAFSVIGCARDNGSDGPAAGGACDNSDPFLVGAVLSLSGAAAEGGRQTQAGIDIAVADLNAGSGILGRCVEVLYGDDQADATIASQVTRQLVDRDGVEFVVGVINSSTIPATAQVTGEAKKILVIGATDKVDYSQNPYVFRNEVTVDQIGAKYVDYMKNNLKLQRFGILAVNNAYGRGVVAGVEAAAQTAGLTNVTTEYFDPTALNLRTEVQKIRDAGAQALVTVVYGQAAIVALQARYDIGWTDPVFGSNGFATKNIVEGVGVDAMQNLLVSPTYEKLNRTSGSADITDERVIDFRTKLLAKLGISEMDDLMQQYVSGYDMISIVAQAYNAVGKNDVDAVREYLEANPIDGIKATYRFSPGNHDGVPNAAIGMATATSLKNGVLEEAAA